MLEKIAIDPAKLPVLPFDWKLDCNASVDDCRLIYSLLTTVITGHNTDVEHDGVVYHVQTEDKGLESPFILSLVYSGGAILASKRSRYEDLLASGFSEELLSERLNRQHRLICAAIHAGRLEDLKRMGSQGAPTLGAEQPEAKPGQTAESPEQFLPAASSKADHMAAYTVHDPRRQSPLGELPTMKEALVITVLNEQEIRSGDALTLRVRVGYRSGDREKPISDAAVSIKVLGTTFRPQLCSAKTQKDGVALLMIQIPTFTSGRAAILIRAFANGRESETRRVVHPS